MKERTGAARKSSAGLTAKEGAERVAERLRREASRTATSNRKRRGNPYRCEVCGGKEFTFEREFTSVVTKTEALECTCDSSASDTAGVREIVQEWACFSREALTEDHHEPVEAYTYDEQEVEEEVIEYIEEACTTCVDNASDSEWCCEGDDEVIHEESCRVMCEGCEHEIEFGWSPDRQRVRPCESLDFDPTACVPDSQYMAAWIERGWHSARPADVDKSHDDAGVPNHLSDGG